MITRIVKKMLAFALAAVMLVGVMPGFVVEAGYAALLDDIPIGSTVTVVAEAPIFERVEPYQLGTRGVNQIGTLVVGEAVGIVSHGRTWRTMEVQIGGTISSGRWLGVEVRGIRGYVQQATRLVGSAGGGWTAEVSTPLELGQPIPTPATGNWWDDPYWWRNTDSGIENWYENLPPHWGHDISEWWNEVPLWWWREVPYTFWVDSRDRWSRVPANWWVNVRPEWRNMTYWWRFIPEWWWADVPETWWRDVPAWWTRDVPAWWWREVPVWWWRNTPEWWYPMPNVRPAPTVTITIQPPPFPPDMRRPEDRPLPNPHSPWARDTILLAFEYDLVPETLAGPDVDFTRPITRAEFAGIAVMLYTSITDRVAMPTLTNPFDDTRDPYVLRAYNNHLMVGVGDRRFAPNDFLERQQAAGALTRTFMRTVNNQWTTDMPLPNHAPHAPFADHADISSWAVRYVYFMAANDVMHSVGNNMFLPRSTVEVEQAFGYAVVTREQALNIALRLLMFN